MRSLERAYGACTPRCQTGGWHCDTNATNGNYLVSASAAPRFLRKRPYPVSCNLQYFRALRGTCCALTQVVQEGPNASNCRTDLPHHLAAAAAHSSRLWMILHSAESREIFYFQPGKDNVMLPIRRQIGRGFIPRLRSAGCFQWQAGGRQGPRRFETCLRHFEGCFVANVFLTLQSRQEHREH